MYHREARVDVSPQWKYCLVNYLDMKTSKAVTQGGVIDEAAMLEDFAKSTDESRAVLCTHMLCYVLDGSIGISETPNV